MRRNGFMVLCGALGVAGALGGCFDQGVLMPGAISGGGTAQGGMGGVGAAGGAGGTGGVGGAGAAGGAGGAGAAGGGGSEPCEPCYTGPESTRRVGECKDGCLRGGTCVDEVLPRTEACTKANDESCDGVAECTGAHEWSTQLGVNGEQIGHDVIFDREGNILVAGAFSTSLDSVGSQGASDGFVVKLGPGGAKEWSKAFGGNGSDSCNRVALDKNGGVILAGTFENTLNFDGTPLTSKGSSDVFVAKLDAEGALDWIKTIAGPSVDRVYGLAVDPDDNIVVAGSFTDWADVLGGRQMGGDRLTSKGGEDIFVAKMDPLGNFAWSRNFGDTTAEVANDAAVTPEGDVVLVGRIAGEVYFGTTLLDAQGDDAFIAKLNGGGTPLWAKIFGDTMSQEFTAVAVDAKGDIVVAGSTGGTINFDGAPRRYAGGNDAVVAAFNEEGKHLWNRLYGDAEDQKALGVAVDQAGNVIVVGEFESSIDFGAPSPRLQALGGTDAFFAKLTPNGDTAWAKSFGDAAEQRARAVAVDELGAIALTGSFSGRIDLGGDPMMSSGGADAFVAKLKP
ncbi:SBBP repeat-containing protein [Sorangium sp. So ce426]|uniref:SBBP repeat-containing protein n=1 Tax=Sorangium sp. So ce426 TaxID=3133312 RepID=UPI003F5AECB3